MTLMPDQGVLAGTAPVADSGETFFCTFHVTESDPGFRPARSVSHGLQLVVTGGVDHLSIDSPQGGEPVELSFPAGRAVQHTPPFSISGGVRPYVIELEGCPDWVTLIPDQRILAGTAPAADSGNTFFCSFRVTESDPGFRPARSVSHGLQLVVTGEIPVGWRFRTRTVEPAGPCVLPGKGSIPVATLPRAHGGTAVSYTHLTLPTKRIV